MHLHTDASRIRYWLASQQPQPPVPELLSELFSEELGYPITPTDIGLDATDEHEVGLRYSESITATVVAVAELGSAPTAPSPPRATSMTRHTKSSPKRASTNG